MKNIPKTGQKLVWNWFENGEIFFKNQSIIGEKLVEIALKMLQEPTECSFEISQSKRATIIIG